MGEGFADAGKLGQLKPCGGIRVDANANAPDLVRVHHKRPDNMSMVILSDQKRAEDEGDHRGTWRPVTPD